MITSLTTKIGNLIVFPIKKHLSIGVSSFVLLFVFLVSANSQSLFRSNGVLTTASNYSTNSLPSSSVDVKLTTTTTSLDLSLSSLSMRSLNTVSGLSYTLNYATNSSSNSTLTLGGSGFTNSVSGVINDLIYVGSGSLNISGTNTGAKLLLVLQILDNLMYQLALLYQLGHRRVVVLVGQKLLKQGEVL